VETIHRFLIIVCILLCTSVLETQGQCVVINEILVDPAGNDGTPPNSGEWVELINTCPTAQDIGCMIIGDGEFSLTIPSGTVLQPGAVYTISAGLNGQTPDLNWTTCNCSSNPTLSGSLLNTSDQLFLLDNTGNLESGVYWGSNPSIWTAIVSSVASNGCGALTGINLIDDTGFDLITVTEGTTNELNCNGDWIASPMPSFGTTNSDQVPEAIITTTNNIVCEGGTLNFNGSSSTGSSFNWTFPGGTPSTSIDQNPIGVAFNNFGMQTVQLTVSNSCGQSASTTAQIQVDQPVLPTISASGPTTLCQGETLDLSTTAAGTLQWRLDGADLTGETNATYTLSAAGSYTVVANNGVCTEESSPVVVTVNPVPVASIVTTDTEVCTDESLILEATSGFTSYSWSEGGVSISTLSNYDVITSNPGTFTYQLTVTENGCTSEPIDVTATVYAFPMVQITPAGPLELCPGDEVVLSSVNSHTTYQWYEDGTPTATTATLNIAYQQVTSVYLEATDNGCTSISNTVDVVSNDVATVAGWTPPPYSFDNTLSTCLSEHPLLGFSDGAVIQWFLNGNAIPAENGLILNAAADGDYYFSASITGACPIYSDTITVNVDVDMSIETTVTKDTACAGEIVDIIPSGNFVSYSWPGGIIADTLHVTNSGEYIVTAHLVSCDTTDTVNVFFSPYPIVNAGKDFYSDCEENTLLLGQSDGDETYWEIDGIEVGTGDTTAISTPKKTTDLVMISKLNGCESRDTVNMKVECIYVYAPTAITPDGDGLNDVFRIYANGLSTFVLRIFNRYGQVVWETSDPEDVWTGGAPNFYVPNGIYSWQIEALDYNQQELLSKKHNHGTILVIR
jgi:gliding motility-associated-like protein